MGPGATTANGRLGINTVVDADVATQLPGLSGVATVSADFFDTVALKADGTVSALELTPSAGA